MEDTNIQLDEMRQQIALLKAKLDKEAIVNDQLLRQSMRQKMGYINKSALIQYIAGFFTIIFGSKVFFEITKSELFVAVTIVYMLICMFSTYYIHSNVRGNDVNGDLLSVAKKMRKVRQQYNNWLYFAYPSMAAWLGWLIYLVMKVNDAIHGEVLIIGLLTGTAIGGIIGFLMHKKVVDTCSEIIAQIEE